MVLDPAAIIGNGHVHQPIRGGVIGQQAAKAIADRGDPAVQARLGFQCVNGQFDVFLGLADVGGVHQLDGTFPAGFVVAQFDALAAAPEQVRCNDQVAVGSVLLGDRANVLIHAEDLLDQHDPRTLAGMRDGQVSAEFTLGAVDLDPLGGHAHGGSCLRK
ncbi:hypothetical protein D3C86_1746390 [compost metagenome]